MPEPNAPRGDGLADLRRGTDCVLYLCRVVAFPVEVCVTRFGTWGPRYLDVPAVLGAFWPLVFLGLTGPHSGDDARPVLLFWWGTLALLLTHRVAGIRRRARGYRCHSRFRGQSWFARPSDPPGTNRSAVREFVVVFGVAGVTVAAGSRPLGFLLLAGIAALSVIRLAVQQALEARLREMEDLRIENEFVTELFRERTDRR